MVDVRFQTAIANDLPSFLLSPAEKLEHGQENHHVLGQAAKKPARAGDLPVLGQAPEFTDTQRWFNTPASAPLTMLGLRGRVVLVDFWTYTCINCIRTFPHLKALDAKYRKDGLTIVGVHSPEFPFERNASNVADAIRQNGLRYPVAQDNHLGTWNAWSNQYWPADYLVDGRGRVRYANFGEGGYQKTERAVRRLLRDAGRARLGGYTQSHPQTAARGLQTPETYLGAKRADGFVNGPIVAGARDFGRGIPRLSANSFGYSGRWQVSEESATAAAGARIGVDFLARRVFLVLGSPDRSRRLAVLLDGKPIPARLAGADVHHGAVMVRAQRLYRLVNLPRVEDHVLTLVPQPGISGYAFTFG
jgi:thiol-disulfide isomerase/thioredoxin